MFRGGTPQITEDNNIVPTKPADVFYCLLSQLCFLFESLIVGEQSLLRSGTLRGEEGLPPGLSFQAVNVRSVARLKRSESSTEESPAAMSLAHHVRTVASNRIRLKPVRIEGSIALGAKLKLCRTPHRRFISTGQFRCLSGRNHSRNRTFEVGHPRE